MRTSSLLLSAIFALALLSVTSLAAQEEQHLDDDLDLASILARDDDIPDAETEDDNTPADDDETQGDDNVDEDVEEDVEQGPQPWIFSACPTDPAHWGGAGLYCHERSLVYCAAPGVLPHVVESCGGDCVASSKGFADHCESDDAADSADNLARGQQMEAESKGLPPSSSSSNVPPRSFATPNGGAPAPTPGSFTPTTAFMTCIGVPAANAASWATALKTTLDKFGITSLEEIKTFLGNCSVESAYWKTTTEYGTKLCPHYSGGCKYKGRGIVQITNDYTYEAAGKFFSQPFFTQPDLISQMPWAFETAGWFWVNYKKIKKYCFSGSLTAACSEKCAAARINGYHRLASAACGIKDPNGWKERVAQVAKVGRCMGLK